MADSVFIRYLNTDLELVCDVEPAQLVAEFEACDLFTHVHYGDDQLFYVMCEDMNKHEPEPNIIRLLDAVDALSDSALAIWQCCTKREFDVGFDCGDEPWGFRQGLSNDVLRRIAACGASLRVTLYPHRPESEENEQGDLPIPKNPHGSSQLPPAESELTWQAALLIAIPVAGGTFTSIALLSLLLTPVFNLARLATNSDAVGYSAFVLSPLGVLVPAVAYWCLPHREALKRYLALCIAIGAAAALLFNLPGGVWMFVDLD